MSCDNYLALAAEEDYQTILKYYGLERIKTAYRNDNFLNNLNIETLARMRPSRTAQKNLANLVKYIPDFEGKREYFISDKIMMFKAVAEFLALMS